MWLIALGTNLRRLTTFAGTQPSWSPDSRRILFLSKAGGEGTVPDLWSMNADGTNQNASERRAVG